MRVNDERWGRCSLGHSFQEDCRYERAVPSDGSLAAPAAQEGLQAAFLYTGICFSLNFPGVRLRKWLHQHFPWGCDCTRFLSGYFCQAENPHSNDLAGRSQAGLETAQFADQAGSVRKAKGKLGIIAALNVLGDRTSWNPFVLLNQAIVIFPLHTEGKS